jgi:hypothetical protein
MWRSVSVLGAAIAGIAVAGQGGIAAEERRAVEPVKAVAILVDTSQALRPHVHDVRKALRTFIRDMQPTHEIALIEFGERTSVLTDYTSDPVRLQAGVERVFAHTGSGAYVLDAIVETSKGLRSREGAPASIVVITAEGPEFSNRYHEGVLDELKSTSATLHAFVLATARGPSLRDVGARERDLALARGAKLTGGSREHLLTSMALESRLRELAARLKQG